MAFRDVITGMVDRSIVVARDRLQPTTSPPQSAHCVLQEEHRAIADARRAKHLQEPPPPRGPTDYIGLALSGGGLGTATFCLGFIQGLAKYELLPHIDYLSTVSGGGYSGAWLIAWIRRLAGDPRDLRMIGANAALEEVQRLLHPHQPDHNHVATEPIRHVRKQIKSLVPTASLFSVDTWLTAAAWSRNTALNLVTLVCSVATVLLLARLAAVGLRSWPNTQESKLSLLEPILIIATELSASISINRNLRRLRDQANKTAETAHGSDSITDDDINVHVRILVPMTVGAAGIAAFMYRSPSYFIDRSVQIGYSLLLAFFVITLLGGFATAVAKRLARTENPAPAFHALAILLSLALSSITGFIVTTLLYVCATFLISLSPEEGLLWSPWIVAALGVPTVHLVGAVAFALHEGVLGPDLPDGAREWLGRLRTWLIIYAFGWALIFGLALFGPLLVYGFVPWNVTAGWSWAITTIAGLYAGIQNQSVGEVVTSVRTQIKQALGAAASFVFVGGLCLLLTVAIHELVSPPARTDFVHASTTPREPAVPYSHGEARWHTYVQDLDRTNIGSWSASIGDIDWYGLEPLVLLCAGVALFLASRVDVNKFSMHEFQRSRLVRCYLGASDRWRRPDPFTGVASSDDLPLASYVTHGSESDLPFCGPYPIVNAALIASGGRYSRDERRAESFIFTPLYSGFSGTDWAQRRYAYRPTKEYGFVGGIDAGQALAISGIVLPSPRLYQSIALLLASPLRMLAFLNTRLGWWLGNPASRRHYRSSSPAFGFLYLLVELFGLASTERKYVNVADGGHFENLGIYELIRRRCRYVIACDADDRGFTLGGLANAIRRCGIDFGAQIDIQVNRLKPDSTGQSSVHCVSGTIQYDDGTTGDLLYLKSSLSGDEDSDVLDYQSRNASFPHEARDDQWADDSQFESYRKLGLHVADAAFNAIDPLASRPGTYDEQKRAFFADLHLKHYPTSDVIAPVLAKHAETFSELLKALADLKTLGDLDGSVVLGEWMPRTGQETDGEPERAVHHWCNSALLFMASLYRELDLDNPERQKHPEIAWWILLFRRWSVAPPFLRTWKIVRERYGIPFQRFFTRLQKIRADEITGCWKRESASVVPGLEIDSIELSWAVSDSVGDFRGTVRAIDKQECRMTDIKYKGATFTFVAGGIRYTLTTPESLRPRAFLSLDGAPQTTVNFTKVFRGSPSTAKNESSR